MIRSPYRIAVATSLALASAQALSIREFRRYPEERQATYISGAVSMLAYSYAAQGDTAKARCVREFYFGSKGKESPGPREFAIEIGIAEQRDSERLQVEGVILGTVERACGHESKPKP